MKRLIASLPLIALLAIAGSDSVAALGNGFTYQGSLEDAGQPANGSFDLQFVLQTQGGIQHATPLQIQDVAVSAGVFTVELDFGTPITGGDFQLQIGVRPGPSTSAYTQLSPPTRISATPQAQIAGMALEAVTVSPDSIASSNLIDGSITAADVDSSQVQRRIATGCGAGQAMAGILADGSVGCASARQGGSGPTGPTGAIGAQGPAGADGAPGPIGPPGATGVAGETGLAGPAGLAGDPGAQGPAGPQGPAGATGAAGATGPQGPVGPMGPVGLEGPSGPIGPAGTTGVAGPQGPAGAAGPAGPPGFTGPQGPAGIAGITGPVGPRGFDGATGAQGPAGPRGATGPEGLGRGAAEASVLDFSTGAQNFIPALTARLNSFNFNTAAEDIQILDSGTYTAFKILRSGTYNLHYAATYRMDASPDILRHETWLVASATCSSAELTSDSPGYAFANTSAIVNAQLFYVVSGTQMVPLNAGTCLALRGKYILGATPPGSAEMVRGQVIVRRLR